MIELYTFPTPNGRKPTIMLEEVGLPYTVITVDISKDEQFHPEFVALNPNSKIPAIVDKDANLTLFESGAILIYLAEKTGQLLPTDIRGRANVIQWLMFQMGNVGPMLGQYSHFRRNQPDNEYAMQRYRNESLRLFGVMDNCLADRDYLASNDYSIADIATYPWVMTYEHLQLPIGDYPNLKRWTERLGQRPAVEKGMALKKT